MAKKKKNNQPRTKVENGEQAREFAYDALVRVLPNLKVGPLLRDLPDTPIDSVPDKRPSPPGEQVIAYMENDEKRTQAVMQKLKSDLGDEMYESLIGLEERSFTEINPHSGAVSGNLVGALRIRRENAELGDYIYHEAPLEPSERKLLESIDMDKLYELFTDQEREIIEQSGAFNKTSLPDEMFTERFLFPYVRYDEVVHPPVGDVEVHSEPPTDLIAAQHVANELKYISTILETTEMRQLVSELYYELRAGRPVTHLALSDIVADAVGPSLVERYLMSADSTYQYSTAQYLKAYQALREAKQQYEVDLLCARMEGAFAATDANFFINRFTSENMFHQVAQKGSDDSDS